MSQSYRLRFERSSLKLKVNTRIPAQLVGGSGITITKTSGIWTVAVDFTGSVGSAVQAWDADLDSISALSSTGIAVRTADTLWAQRSIAGTANEITLTNGDGVSGNPTASLPTALTFTGKTVTGGTFSAPTLVTPILGVASATSINKVTITAPATSATLTLIDGTTLTGPAASGTAMTLGNTETVTGIKTFGSAGAVGRLKIAGTTSGSTILDATATASGTLTLPAATDTLIGKATSDTLTNKTFDTAGTGNSLSINGVAATANTGTGAVARAVSPSFTTPTLGAATATSLAMGSALIADTVGGVRFISNDVAAALVQYGSGAAGGGVVAFYSAGVERGRISASASDWTFGLAASTQGTLTFAGATSGGTKLTALAAASGTLTLPSATDTLVGKATTDTLTNKTLTSPVLTTPSLGVATATSINGVTLDNNAWTTYTPSVAAQTGSGVTATVSGRYKQLGKTVIAQADITITAVGTGSGGLVIGLPFTAAAFQYAGACREYNLTGAAGAALVLASASTMDLRTAAGATYIALNNKIVATITYEVP